MLGYGPDEFIETHNKWLDRLHPEDRERAVSYTHLRAHETVLDIVCRLLLEKKKKNNTLEQSYIQSLTQSVNLESYMCILLQPHVITFVSIIAH